MSRYMPARAEESSSSCAQNQRVRITPMFDHQLSITPTAIHPPGPSNAQFQTRFKAEDRLLCNFSGATWQPTANMEKGPSKRFWYTFYQFLRNLTGIFPRYPGEKRTGGCKVVNLCFKSLPASPVRGPGGWSFGPLSREYGGLKTVKARFQPRLAGKSPQNLSRCSLFAWQQTEQIPSKIVERSRGGLVFKAHR